MAEVKLEFGVGDRVIGAGRQDGVCLTGLTGTVVHVYSDSRLFSVEWDEENNKFHSCGGRAKDRHGWNCSEHVLEHLTESEPWDLESESEFAELFV